MKTGKSRNARKIGKHGKVAVWIKQIQAAAITLKKRHTQHSNCKNAEQIGEEGPFLIDTLGLLVIGIVPFNPTL